MNFTDEQRAFLEQTHSAAMITLRPDGTPHTVRCGVAVVDGKLWSSGTQRRVRTKHVRRDPRSTIFVFDQQFRSLSIESTVTLLEGPDAAEANLRLFRVMQQRPSGPLAWYGSELDTDAFVRRMLEEQRLIYQFEPQRVYGLVSRPPGR